jgi:hypothetical protein
MRKWLMRHFVVCLSATCLLISPSARAELLLTVERLSDTTAIISGTGELESPAPGGTPSWLTLIDAVNGVTGTLATTSGVFEVGSIPLDIAGISPIFLDILVLQFEASLSVGDQPTGQVEVTLQGGDQWAAVGTAGIIVWGIDDAVVAGRFEIVATSVPEPGTAAMLLLALGVLANRLRRIG